MIVPELLAPAGNFEKLKMALHYGADAVYLGGEEFSLRNLADNFTPEGLGDAVVYAHARGAKVYLTTNIFPGNDDLEGMMRYLEKIREIPFDAYIVADPGVLDLVREVSPERVIHLSTQANTTNWRSARFWQRQGVARVNLAREMTLADIRGFKDHLAMELEVFVHGAMCISYSGRCLLSSVMTGRDANKGECAHPCRWGYALVEEQRPGSYFPVLEDDRGTFIFNSKDLCLLEYLPELIGAGVDSLKIEGRMKGINYVASVVRVYREALDRYRENPETYAVKDEWLEELKKISHRGYTSGFLFGTPGQEDHEYQTGYLRSHEFVGVVTECAEDGSIIIEVRNRISADDELEFIGRGMASQRFSLSGMTSEANDYPLTVAHPNQRVRLRVPFHVEPLDLIRREKIPSRIDGE
ncbi:MAG: U32 family peptidase [Deltaproteobacteria bacterium]|nr:U32 family peptidase [Deltaproteobacteria bacterium]TLN05251.1 MAG: U32 family peptidase [bacterium]